MNMRLRIPVIVLMQLAIYCDGGVKSGQFNRYKSEFGVSTTVPKYGVPRRLFEGDSYYESHASNIEEYAFKIDSKRGPKGNKHKNFTIDLHILGKGCRGLTICFGPKSNLEEHRRILQKIGSPTKDDKRYEMKLTEEVKNLINEGKYVVDACKGMTVLELRFPIPWNMPTEPFGPYDFSTIFYSGIDAGRDGAPIGHKVAGLSNWERLTFFHKHKNQKGIELMHGPYNYTTADSKEWFSTAQTTFYETTDIFDEEKNPMFYVVLAQAAQVCRARLKPRKVTVAFMELQNGINFKPMTIFSERTGANIWAIFFGFLVGCIIGTTATGMALCLKSRKIYTQWNDEMKKVYGKFAALDATTIGGDTTVGGNTTMGDVSVSQVMK